MATHVGFAKERGIKDERPGSVRAYAYLTAGGTVHVSMTIFLYIIRGLRAYLSIGRSIRLFGRL